MKQVVASILDNSEVMLGVYLIWLKSPQIASEAKPGQFVMVCCGGDCVLPRPLSIHQRSDDKIALLFSVVGKGTSWLSQLDKDDTVELFGPLGNGFSILPASQNLLLVAGGMGFAPLYSLASSASKEGYSIKVIIGVRTAIQLYLKEYQYQSIKAEFVLVTEDGTEGEKGIATNLIPRYVDWADQIFACGPQGMYRSMAQMPELKNKPVQVSLEVRMGCGRGVCYGCTIKTKKGLKRVCEDGPVFDLDDILWDELSL